VADFEPGSGWISGKMEIDAACNEPKERAMSRTTAVIVCLISILAVPAFADNFRLYLVISGTPPVPLKEYTSQKDCTDAAQQTTAYLVQGTSGRALAPGVAAVCIKTD
jgi:hypothetical protein